MKLAQDYLKSTSSEETRGGFNARLQGMSFGECMSGIPSGSRWGEHSRGWEIADSMIKKGDIFSEIETEKGRIEFKCYLDGNLWCCIGPEFTNIQECYAAFGNTQDAAIRKFTAYRQQ